MANSSHDLIINTTTINNRTCRRILVFILFPVHPIILYLKLQHITLKLSVNPTNKELIKTKEVFQSHIAHHKRLELGLETIHQIFAQLILLINAFSYTPTSEGLVESFKEEKYENLVLLSLSITWSFFSCVISHLSGFSAHRVYFPLSSQTMAVVYTFFAIIKRVSCMILYFTPSLGLFSLLRHLQVSYNSIACTL